jgi:S-adenosylmethionine:tRNA ribosyltransferase-isomerase
VLTENFLDSPGRSLYFGPAVQLETFDYELPESLIATVPAEPRDHSRLLAVDRSSGALAHRRFFEIPEQLRPGDLLVMNDTRVLPARLYGEDASGRRLECLLIERGEAPFQWRCLARPGRKIRQPTELSFPEGGRGTIARAADDEHTFTLRFDGFASHAAFLTWIERAGNLPLPPYIKRAAEEGDRLRYQTVYAQDTGSVAAPTAGLHFTQGLLDTLRAKGVEQARVTLHIGYGTFSPIRTNNLDDHQMHEESYQIDPDTFRRLETAKREGRRIIAVGTTSLRALESIPAHGLTGRTRLFIRPGYRFQWVDGLITNFHLPKTSLYVLVSAFLGLDETRAAYAAAVRERYRFFSYGDAMAIL